jgi:hypothetical protein
MYEAGFRECGFRIRRFRPLEPEALELFRKIAASPKREVRA